MSRSIEDIYHSLSLLDVGESYVIYVDGLDDAQRIRISVRYRAKKDGRKFRFRKLGPGACVAERTK